MNTIQSQINLSEARIDQYQNSELFNDQEKTKLIEKEKEILEILLNKKASQIQVNNAETL